MNDYKIQLESLDDLNYLRDELDKFGKNEISSISESTKQKYFDRVFAIISENSQVNGVDFSEIINQNIAMESVNEDLVTKLQELQAETENLLRRTIQHRREVPKVIKSSFVDQSVKFVGGIEKELEGEVEISEEDLELCKLDASISIKPNFYSNKFSSGLSHLTQLQSSIPDVVAKLERAQEVINEEGGRRIDENTQILNRHRRLSRQFDLASKIGNF